MAEPKHNADELLKSYAAERRKSAATELHPAARRILQGEVARVYGSANAAAPWWRKLTAPRFAWSLALVGIMALSIVSLRQPSDTNELPTQAKKQDAEKDMSVGLEVALETGAPPAKSEDMPSPSERLLTDSASLGEPAGPRDFGRGTPPPPARATAPTVTAAGEAPVVLGRELKSLSADQARSEAEGLERRVAAATPAPAAAAPVLLQADNEQAQQQILFFSNVAQTPGQMPAARAVAGRAALQSQVLNRFSFDQRGSELQVRDEDGSLYKGLMTTQQQAQAMYAFRVTGTNNTLRQPVVFTGRVVQAQVPALAQQQQTRARQDQYQRAAQNNFYENNQVRLQGQATVGQSGTVYVDAQNTAAPAAPAQK